MVVDDTRLKDHIDQTLENLHNQAVFYVAEQYGLILVNGKDASSFLQSQLSNDIKELRPGTGQLSCLLDRKAHVEAYFHLYKDYVPSQSFYILIEKEQIAYLIEKLELFRFAAEVEFTAEDGSFMAIQGARANKVFALLEPGLYLNKIAIQDFSDITYGANEIKVFRHTITGENGYFFWTKVQDSTGLSHTVEQISAQLGFTKANDKTINTARIEAGLVKFGIDFDRSNLLPETGLLDLTVSYKKGCFVGQEVLARVKSHGVPAKAIIGLTLDTNLELTNNSPIVSGNEEIGVLKSSAFSPKLNKLIALAILKRDYRVPEKTFDALIDKHEIKATVTITPFIKIQSNKDLARKLFEEAVQKFVKESDGVTPTKAITLLQEVLILDPQLEDAYEALAVILSKHEQLDAAIDIMKALAELNTDSVMAHSNLSQFYVQQGFKEKAEDEKAVALSIRMRLAAAEFASKRTNEAEQEKADRLKRKEMFEQVLSIDKEDFFANAGFGECLVADKDFEKAIPYLKKAIELKFIHMASYLDLAKAYKELSKTHLAKEILNEGIAVATKRGDTVPLQKLQEQLKVL